MIMKIFGLSSWVSAVLLLNASLSHAQVSSGLANGYNNNSFQYLTAVLTPASPTMAVPTNAWNAKGLPKFYSVAFTTTAAGATVAIEGSVNQLTWQSLASTSSIGTMGSNTNPIPALYLRLRASTIGANTAVTATAIATW